MRGALSRALMVLAVRCLGERRRIWGEAMLGEFDVASAAGRGLGFAAGCFAASVRELPRGDEGRLALSRHIIALGIMLPFAALLITSVMTSFPGSYLDPSALYGMPRPRGAETPLLTAANLSAVPPLAALVVLLAAVKLRSAWLVLARDWTRAADALALGAATTATTVFFTVLVFADYSAAIVQAGAWAIEACALLLLARWEVGMAPS